MSNWQYNNWYVEAFGEEGTSFGLAIKQKLHEEKTPFQKIEIYDTERFGKLLALDGCIMLTERDNFLYHEMMTHPALFSHPKPEKVVIIGGGDCGTLKEVLQHPEVKSAWQIEIDERVTQLAQQYFPDLCILNNDPRATLLFEDGMRWIESRAAESVDLIIIDSTDPAGPAAGLFSADFYGNCFQILSPNGILVLQSESPILHANSIIADMHRNLKSSGFSQSITLPFPQPVYPSGWWSSTMAVKLNDIDPIKPDFFAHFREQDSKHKKFQTLYYNHEIHKAALAQPEFLKSALHIDH
ncbi:unnamed protein product [marine sediment metagenome]|uniref:PABS domain-containing protein n=1 Tax=marine sediment metagenome TaxID=412755 RepID=X0ZMH0_9ZZZZ